MVYFPESDGREEGGMATTDRIVTGRQREEDAVLDVSLRPKRLADYIGQERVKENLQILVDAANKRSETLDHVLLYGPPGLGKTTLAGIIAAEMGVAMKITSGPAIEHQGDLVSILTNLNKSDVLFIDEIHRLNRQVEEVLYSAMEDFAVDIIIGKGPSARSMRLSLPPFTLVGATTRLAMLTSPLRDRFGAIYRLDFYSEDAMRQIVTRSARILKVDTEPAGANEIARRARGTPRVANRLLRRVRDFAQVKAEGIISAQVADDALEKLGVDELGLDEVDHRILRAIAQTFNGGPVGIETLAAATSEEADTIMDVYEPFLILQGFMQRTPRGRVVTERAYQHLGLAGKPPALQGSFFDDPAD
jgi:Holliday junction DNA helicase RuvB